MIAVLAGFPAFLTTILMLRRHHGVVRSSPPTPGPGPDPGDPTGDPAPRTPLTSGSRAAADRRTVGWLSAGLATAALPAGLLIAPADEVQGQAQRLMYL